MIDRKATVGDVSKNGFKVDYSKLRKAVLECELNKDRDSNRNECKRILRELNIDVFDTD